MFASAEGNVITGYVYYTTGGKPKNATVLVQDTEGNSLGEVMTNEEGQFTFTAEAKRDYVFVLELSDGHRTTFTLTADELPDSLPMIGAEQTTSPTTARKAVAAEKNSTFTKQDDLVQEAVNAQVPLEEIEKIVANAVSKQIRPLREQLEKYEEKIRLHDILGGIGYIIGLMGLWFFLGGRKKRPDF